MLSVRKLDLFEYEPEAAAGDYPDEKYARTLDDAEVEQLLLSSLRHDPRAGGDEQARPREVADDWDALRAMRGILVGLVLVAPIWGLLIAALVRT